MLGEYGFLERFKSGYFRGIVSSCPRRHQYIKMELQHVRSLFEVFGVISTLSLFSFVIEKLMSIICYSNSSN